MIPYRIKNSSIFLVPLLVCVLFYGCNNKENAENSPADDLMLELAEQYDAELRELPISMLTYIIKDEQQKKALEKLEALKMLNLSDQKANSNVQHVIEELNGFSLEGEYQQAGNEISYYSNKDLKPNEHLVVHRDANQLNLILVKGVISEEDLKMLQKMQI